MAGSVCKCLAVVGATASGKTALAIALARALDGEVISCDSMQVYRHMDIGTAKPTAEEQAQAPHHMIDVLSPTESFCAADYAVRAEACALDVAARGKLPIFCGGTGLYLEAVRTNRHGEPMESDPAFRAAMQALAEREGNEALHARLAEIDSESANAIHPNNVKRVIRALEIYHLTGKTKSESDRLAQTENPRLRIGTIFLDYADRALLYRRIDERVEAMAAAGLFEETERLYREGLLVPGTTAAGAIGYKECLGAVLGSKSREDAVEELKVATHHYAKRQKTWFAAHPHTRIYADLDGAMRPLADVLDEARRYAETFLSE